MIVFWALAYGLPLLAFGGACLACPTAVRGVSPRFLENRLAAVLLTVFAWLWTAYECDIIGIDIFDMILLKELSGGLFVWVLAVVLSYLTVIWMEKNLVMRALSGLLMLMPAEFFKVSRPLLPTSGFDSVQVLVAIAYLGAILGMYGMFYPWRVETAVAFVLKRSWCARALGSLCFVLGLAALIIGFAK